MLLRVVTRLSLGERHPTLFHLRATLHRRHPPSSPCSPNGSDAPVGIRHNAREHSPNHSAAGPLSTRHSGDRLHLSVISGGSIRSQERSRGKRARRSKKQGAFVGKCGENHGKRGAFSRLCGIRSAHKPTPVRRSRRQEKTVRSLPSEEEGGPIFIGTLRTTAADSRERLGDDSAKTGVSKPIRLSPLYSARGQREATRQCRPHTAGRREFDGLSVPPSPRLLPAVRDQCRVPPPYPWRQ